jgi:hypothetical protein
MPCSTAWRCSPFSSVRYAEPCMSNHPSHAVSASFVFCSSSSCKQLRP